MRLFARRKSRKKATVKEERAAVLEALEEWMSSRHGIEMYVEPQTTVTGTTVLLVAHDGEFTRRPIPSPQVAETFAREHTLPIYEAEVVGYPQRMRDYSRKQTLLKKRAARERLGE